MSKLQEMQDKFLATVKPEDIKYDWDGGWCYSMISHPIMEQAEQELSHTENTNGVSDHEEFLYFTDQWLSDNDGELFHMSDIEGEYLVNQVHNSWGDKYTDYQPLKGAEAKEYAKGLIALIEKSGEKFYDPKLAELKAFITKY